MTSTPDPAMTSSRPVLSIVVPTWNRADLLEQLLEHLLFVNSLPFSVEIIISDNASMDATPAVVERYKAKLPIRYYLQPVNLGAEHNINSALRSATGRYTVYLADDDRLVPDAVVRHIALLEERPEIVMLQAPWILWDEDAEQVRGLFYSVDHLTIFDSSGVLACWEFLLSRKVLPEQAIYQTEVMLKLMHPPHSIYVTFLMVLRAFQFGSVCFHPEPYYRSISRAQGGVADGSLGQLGHTHAMSQLDHYRGGLEVALLSALREVAPLPTPAELKNKALLLINRFLIGRLEVATRLSLARRDFIAAFEFKRREWMWRDVLASEEVVEWEQKYLTFVALQSVAELQRAHSHFGALVLCGFAQADVSTCCWILDQLSPATEVVVLSVEEALAQQDLAQHLYLVESESVREQLLEADLAVGQVLRLDEVKDQYRTLPRSFSV